MKFQHSLVLLIKHVPHDPINHNDKNEGRHDTALLFPFFSLVMVPLISASEICDVVISNNCCVTTAPRLSGMHVSPSRTTRFEQIASMQLVGLVTKYVCLL